MTELQKRLFAAFDAEHRSILETIRAFVAGVENGTQAANGEPLTHAFRMAHTLKGSAHVVGFSTIVTLGHRLESLFAKVREGQIQLGLAEIRVIHSVLDKIEDIVAAAQKKAPAPDEQAVLAGIEALLGLAPTPLAPVAAPVAAAPPPPAVPILAVAAPAPVPAVAVPAESETVRLNAAHLDQLLATTGELLSTIQGGHQIETEVFGIGERVDAILREWNFLRRSSADVLQQQKLNDRPEFARVLQFLEFVGAELLPLSKRIRSVRETTKQNEWELRELSAQLQDDVRKARVVPAETVFAGFNKMVRDLATDLDRPVDFRLSGLEVEADRFVLQALKDPMMHLLRNSLGHGIENKDVRLAQGKDPIGRISVRIKASSGHLTIAIEDDGQGLNSEKIRSHAQAMGLIREDEVSALERDGLAQMIFKPGFSTAAEISNLQGRGMGMSVVAEAIERLQGRIKVDWEEKKKTVFTISVPISLANHRLILAKDQGATYAIPCRSVKSLHRLKREDLKMVDGKLSFIMNEGPVAVINLSSALGTSGSGVSFTDDLVSVIVLRGTDRDLALAVEFISDECESIIKNLGAPFRHQRIFSGAILQGDGTLALVLDPQVLLEQGQTSARSGSYSVQSRPALVTKVTEPLRILVVDDSITTRTLEKGILESSGYHVTLAVDGIDAFARLQLETFDLVISDVEMPRMDGFTLVSEIKKHPKFSKIPVIMVTSLEKPEDRERGMKLGANAYVLKQKFDQGALLETIRKIV